MIMQKKCIYQYTRNFVQRSELISYEPASLILWNTVHYLKAIAIDTNKKEWQITT